ncbi:MAG: hypothetical protein ACI9EW_000800 [Cellvibrionaceae bacterium]|jgi:uncharacterized protein YqhQ
MEKPNEKPLYGGQAVMEGVMMRGKNAYAVAVRDPENRIVVHTQPLNPAIYNSFISRTPFLRGITMLWDALGIGMKALMFSADIAVPEEEDNSEMNQRDHQPDMELSSKMASETINRQADDIFSQPMMIGAVALSLCFSVGIFIALPAAIAEFFIQANEQHLLSNVLEGVVKLTLLIGYIWGIGFIPDIKRVFSYHGAEHKTINAYEAGAELTPKSVQRFPLEHPRCGTGFLLTVVLISIIIFTLIPLPDPFPSTIFDNILIRVLSRVILIPVIAGIAYEFLRFTAKHQDNGFIRAITRPNMALQRLTTREPELDMLEVAITSFNRVRDADLAVAAAD